MTGGRRGPNRELGPNRAGEIKRVSDCVGREGEDVVPNLCKPFIGSPEPPLYGLALQAWHEALRVVTPPGLHRDAIRPRRKRASLWAAVRVSGVSEIQA